jgi:hypothetical protein
MFFHQEMTEQRYLAIEGYEQNGIFSVAVKV